MIHVDKIHFHKQMLQKNVFFNEDEKNCYYNKLCR